MSQVAAMLNYGEMQILENFKNTLPYWLYSTLINVNNLRDAIDLSKRELTKEKLDRQLTGQSSTPFMKVASKDNHSLQNHHKKEVTFDAMEMLERKSDCIERLTSLVSDMKMTMEREQPPYKPKVYQVRSQNQNSGQQNFTHRNRSYSRGRNQGGNRVNYNNRNNYRPNYRNRLRGRWNNHRLGDRSNHIRITTDKVIWDQITDKMPNGLLGTEVSVGIEMKIINDYTRGRSKDRNNSRSVTSRREESMSWSNFRVSTNHNWVRCYRCREYDHFVSECPNTQTDEETDYEEADPASLQIMTQNYCSINSEGEAEYLNL